MCNHCNVKCFARIPVLTNCYHVYSYCFFMLNMLSSISTNTTSYVIVKSTFVSVFTIKRPIGASEARARVVLMMKILYTCTVSI